MPVTPTNSQQPFSDNPSAIGERKERLSERGAAYEVVYRNGESFIHGLGRPAFTFLVKDEAHWAHLLHCDLYSAASAFIRGDFDIHGDLVAAVRFKRENTPRRLGDWLASIAARIAPRRIESWFQTSVRAAQNIRFHYDRSNRFYGSFLDSRMVYSCAYFKDAAQNIEDAQLGKLDHICRKLDLRPEERFLDIGCGWGALLIHAAEKYGARSTGCTLSLEQEAFAAADIAEKSLKDRVTILESDYRALSGQFTKIASVGMFEHVGRRRLREYFRKVYSLLEDEGLFLNHGIVRPERVGDGPETLFLQRKVFPGGELATVSNVIREAGRAGFEVLDVENLRPHYGLTCRRWVERLQRNAEECLRHVDRETYRTWLLYLAGSALSFESGTTDLCQILMAKRRGSGFRRLTRDYMYLHGNT